MVEPAVIIPLFIKEPIPFESEDIVKTPFTSKFFELLIVNLPKEAMVKLLHS
jgi:hypothetical protein